MDSSEKIRIIREQTELNRKEFAEYFGIPLRTIEEWEAGRRTPPEYVPRLMEYRIKYEELMERKKKEDD